jgi:hypothetical protein
VGLFTFLGLKDVGVVKEPRMLRAGEKDLVLSVWCVNNFDKTKAEELLQGCSW